MLGIVERIATTRIGTELSKRPRLAITLALLVLFVAVQGGAAAVDGSFTTQGTKTHTDTGP